MLTCKQFLQDLTDYLDESLDPKLRSELQRHVNECPNCWVLCDTTKKTLKVFKGMECHAVPREVESRLLAALERMKRDKGCGSGKKPDC